MFTFPVDPAALLTERARQFSSLGIPAAVVAQTKTEICDVWGTDHNGWVPVWARHAERAERAGEPLLASLCWGAARFPALATPDRHDAHQRQLACYLQASTTFPVRFRRQIIDVSYDGGTTAIPVHFFQRRILRRRGVLVLCGGVDTWKMDLHRLAVATALATGLLVAAIDMPGTGESAVPLAPGNDRILAALVGRLRKQHAAPIGFWGLSFGGHWAAKLALLGEVDAAVDLGGPTGAADDVVDVLNLPHGMAGIIGNAFGLDALPPPGRVEELIGLFSLRAQGLLDAPGGTPLLAANGADDQYVLLGDTTGLAGRPRTTVWVVRDATHCAPERFVPLTVATWGWMLARLAPGRRAPRIAERALRVPLVPFLVSVPGGTLGTRRIITDPA